MSEIPTGSEPQREPKARFCHFAATCISGFSTGLDREQGGRGVRLDFRSRLRETPGLSLDTGGVLMHRVPEALLTEVGLGGWIFIGLMFIAIGLWSWRS